MHICRYIHRRSPVPTNLTHQLVYDHVMITIRGKRNTNNERTYLIFFGLSAFLFSQIMCLFKRISQFLLKSLVCLSTFYLHICIVCLYGAFAGHTSLPVSL